MESDRKALKERWLNKFVDTMLDLYPHPCSSTTALWFQCPVHFLFKMLCLILHQMFHKYRCLIWNQILKDISTILRYIVLYKLWSYRPTWSFFQSPPWWLCSYVGNVLPLQMLQNNRFVWLKVLSHKLQPIWYFLYGHNLGINSQRILNENTTRVYYSYKSIGNSVGSLISAL